MERLNNAKNKLKENNLDKVSLTDPDSSWMANKKHYYELLYNLQITYVYDSRLILDNRIANHSTDTKEFIPAIESLSNIVGELDDNIIITADSGFYSGDNLAYVGENGLNVIMPNKAQASLKKGNDLDPFSKHYFPV